MVLQKQERNLERVEGIIRQTLKRNKVDKLKGCVNSAAFFTIIQQ